MGVSFSDRELDVMTVLWARGPSTVGEVRAALAREADADLAYTTVLTVLRTLEAKGHVGHAEEGRAHRYHARVARYDAGRSAVRRLLGTVFRGSPELLLTHLVQERGVSDAELRRMRALLDARLGAAAGAAPDAGEHAAADDVPNDPPGGRPRDTPRAAGARRGRRPGRGGAA